MTSFIFVANNKSALLNIKAVIENGDSPYYRWFKSIDGNVNNGTPLTEWSTTSQYETPVFSEKGIYYYFCKAASKIPNNDNDSNIVVSKVITVAYTGLPTLYIETPNSAPVNSKTDWIGNATISITGALNDEWNVSNITTSIRGRGNTTWQQPKKPYALKLNKIQEIFGLPAHNRWVLIANYLDNSFMRNEMGFYFSKSFEMDWTVHGKFVDFVLNGKYMGLYWFGEAILPDKNRVNINNGRMDMADNEDKDYLIEMDVYFDEAVKFWSPKRLPYMIKNEDFMIDENMQLTSGGKARTDRLITKINNLEHLLYTENGIPDESYSNIIDIDSWAKYWFINEIMTNKELQHPKSCYFTYDSVNNIFKAGPVWDYDWSSLQFSKKCLLKDTIYYDALFNSKKFQIRTIELWEKYSNNLDIASQMESFRSDLSVAVQCDSKIWKVHADPSGIIRKNFDAYVDFLKDLLIKRFAVVNSEIEYMKEKLNKPVPETPNNQKQVTENNQEPVPETPNNQEQVTENNQEPVPETSNIQEQVTKNNQNQEIDEEH
ncbi:hypothetical protein PIROE2DRAFT_64978 [Piromyces sp. E2]|nr:hypothetical protein PIROE2DRAFT_64978 [Piromyces sp. E2]|eukprot:OUM57499.1 hypothetical protein PIROE2DRAFT_64978 [Piromyces sp. E2]